MKEVGEELVCPNIASVKAAAAVQLDGQDDCLQHVFDEGNSVKGLDSFSVVDVAVVAEAPMCVSCAGAHADFVCSECELRVLLGQLLELAYTVASFPVGKAGRRRLAQIKQMVSSEFVARVHSEGSPTLLATLSEIKLCLMA